MGDYVNLKVLKGFDKPKAKDLKNVWPLRIFRLDEEPLSTYRSDVKEKYREIDDSLNNIVNFTLLTDNEVVVRKSR